jgi:putative DNA primase/helicase
MMPSPETLYELIAYALWRGYPYQKFWLLVGPGSNGKGVYLTIFTRLLGSENISCVSLREIQNSNFAAGTLHRKLANLSGEVDYSDLNNTGLLKQLTGGDQIQGDRKYLSPVRFVNHSKLIFSTNQVPVTRDCTDAFYRRAFLLEFPNTFKADPTIDVKLREESEHMTEEFEGFLFEVVQRLRELIKSGFIFTQDKDTETIRARYDALSNPLRRFVSENCEQTFSGDDYIYKFEFRERLNAWLLERRFNAYTDERIKREMRSLGHEDGQRGKKRYHSWTGVLWSHSQTSQTSQGGINHSYTHKNQFIKVCELREPCDSDTETDGILTVTEFSS